MPADFMHLDLCSFWQLAVLSSLSDYVLAQLQSELLEESQHALAGTYPTQ
jgi:hypothetical protein